MKILKSFAFLFIFFLAGYSIQAQNQGGFDPAMIVQRQMAELTTALNLDKKQEKKLYYVLTETMDQVAELRGNGKSQEENRSAMMEIFKAQSEIFKKELSPEQFQKYEAIQAERREKMRQNGGNWQRPN